MIHVTNFHVKTSPTLASFCRVCCLGVRSKPLWTVGDLNLSIKFMCQLNIISCESPHFVCPEDNFHVSVLDKMEIRMMTILLCNSSKGIHGIQGSLKILCNEGSGDAMLLLVLCDVCRGSGIQFRLGNNGLSLSEFPHW